VLHDERAYKVWLRDDGTHQGSSLASPFGSVFGSREDLPTSILYSVFSLHIQTIGTEARE